MSLYPITVATAAALSTDPNLIVEGSMICVPIDMTTVQMTKITLQQMSDTQDFSLRGWLSIYQGGLVIGEPYPILKWAGLPIVIYVEGQTPPAETVPNLVTPGQYFLNILNLTNEQNFFDFTKTDLA